MWWQFFSSSILPETNAALLEHEIEAMQSRGKK
jgi:hypothetical protein